MHTILRYTLFGYKNVYLVQMDRACSMREGEYMQGFWWEENIKI
jgi:hypothetical protein